MRQAILNALQDEERFDILVVGGGATGCGIAVDAASRGLKVALLERHDFAGGTSSRSTKLVHGGVRYLEAAVKHLDKVQYHLVREGLYERGVFLKNAPHLAKRLPLVSPVYSWFELPYIAAGLKLYDVLSGSMNVGHSSMISRAEVLKKFPSLKAKDLKGGVVYYDGQFNDIRMAVSLVLTAEEHGAVIANHVQVNAIHHNDAGHICGVEAEDVLTGTKFDVKARVVINAAGPFADAICRMDDPQAAPILKGSAGAHIILDRDKVPLESGFLVPKTDDGRVLFLLPWEQHIIVGTTDTPVEIVDNPEASSEDIAYLLDYVRRFFNVDVDEKDVKAAWCGIRPLVFDPKAKDTAELAREHVIFESKAGLVTIAGGKWTIYRSMAEDTVDRAIQVGKLRPVRGCVTHNLPVVGGRAFTEDGYKILMVKHDLPEDIAKHLHHIYGDQSGKIIELISAFDAARLHPGHPFLEVEVRHAVREEHALRADDVLIRRMTLALLDGEGAKSVVARVVAIMAEELGWDDLRQANEIKRAEKAVVAGL